MTNEGIETIKIWVSVNKISVKDFDDVDKAIGYIQSFKKK